MSTSASGSKSSRANRKPRTVPVDATPAGDRMKLALIITQNDLPPEVRGTIAAVSRKDRVLGGEGASEIQKVFDAIPRSIAQRLERITPKNFRLAEISLELALEVQIPGFEIGGTVTVTLQPSK